MKVYVCYWYDSFEGATPPNKAFSSKERAQEWVNENEDDYGHAYYRELELDDGN